MGQKIPCEIYDRCVGYFAPVNRTANKGKMAEIQDRKRFDANGYCKEEFSQEVRECQTI